MTDWNAVSAFMANVVVWPGSPLDPGFINLHYSMPNPKPTPGRELIKGMGWPYKSVDAFVSRVGWLLTVADKFRDQWFCLSQQSQSGTNRRGNPKAIRLAANATAVKSLWIDVDVGPSEPGKKPKYPDIKTALTEVLKFVRIVGLPQPSAIVYSGGGIHFYWISKDPLTPQEWQPYASGLKNLLLANNVLCDTGLTTDIARILRVPGSLNYKYDPPQPVTLAPLPLVMYDFPAALSQLPPLAGPVISPTQPQSIFADGVTRESFGPIHPLFVGLDKTEPGLQAGIDKFSDQLLKPFPIFRHCGFLRDALSTGGKDYDQTLWMYSVLSSTFMEDGNALAHKISSGHKSYSKDDTQALYDRKMAERHDRGIGYPSCAAIAGAGCEACKTCPLFSKGKSPLHIRPDVTAKVNPAMGQSAAALAVGLPPTFELNSDGIICKVVEKTDKDGETTTQVIPLFQSVLSDFWLQKNPGEFLNFTCTVDKGFTEQVSVPLGAIHASGFLSLLGNKRVLVNGNCELKHFVEFFLSIIGKLRAMAAAQVSVPYGWYEEGGQTRGFSYGGKVYLDDGTERPCGAADPVLQKMWEPTGSMDPWLKAATTVTNRKRPELTTIMLMAFASPLLYLNGKNTAVISAWGTDSGAGKTSAARVGLAVWGHPVACKVSERDTANSVGSKMGKIRHLPFFWDEITDDDMRKKFKAMMHQLDTGKDKDRMIDGQTHQQTNLFQLMLMYGANASLLEFLRKDNKNTWASQMRVLEWEVKRIKGGPGHMMDADAEILLADMNRNYGHMGSKYGKFLALNHVQIKEEFRLKCNEVETKCEGSMTDNGRYWTTTVAVMTLAAKYAQMMGLDVDPQTIEDFMYTVYKANVGDRAAYTKGGRLENAENILAAYIKERAAQQRGLWTNYMHNQKGKPPKPVVVLKGPDNQRNMQGGIEFRFSVDNRALIIGQRDFNEWIESKKHSDTVVYAALGAAYDLKRQRLEICSGTPYVSVREYTIVLTVGESSPLWPVLTRTMTPDEASQMAEDRTFIPDPIDAGFEGDEVLDASGITIDATTGLATAASVSAFVKGATVGAP